MSIISVIVFVLITVALAGSAWYFIQLQYQSYTSKVILAPFGTGSCAGRSASMTIANAGTEAIQTTEPPKEDFGKIGNMIPNPGFEEDANGNGKPDFWEGQETQKTVDAVLVTDLSNSMSDCMDSHEIKPDMNTTLFMHFNDGTFTDSSGWARKSLVKGTGTPATDTDGVKGHAIKLTGLYYDRLVGDLGDPKGMTIEFWIKTPNKNAGSQYIMDARTGGNWWLLQDYGPSGSCTHSEGNICFNSLVEIPPHLIENNKWYHVAITVNASYSKIYLDGQLINSGSGFDPDIGSGATIGARYASVDTTGGSVFSLDELIIYKRVLEPNEIMSHAMTLKGSACPDDGKESPFWCRYETAYCPQSAVGDETYFSGQPVSGFKKLDYVIQSSTSPDSELYTWRLGCSALETCQPGETNGDNSDYRSITGSYQYVGLSDLCPSGSCPTGGYRYSGTSQQVDWTQSCPSGYYQKDYSINAASCAYNDRSSCSAGSACGALYDNGDRNVENLKDSCSASECDSSRTCTSGTTYCAEGSCGSGFSECQDCEENSCSAFEKFCCETSTIKHRCVQKQDYCCSDVKKNCWSVKEKECIGREYRCYNLLQVCSANPIIDLADACEPGIVGSAPKTSNSCSGGWTCIAQGGGCFICDSVAVRLAKKLDRSFVTSVFGYASFGTAKVGLVSYGAALDSSAALADNSGKDSLLANINDYQANKGETCIACAIQKAEELLQGSAANKKYVILMSDGDANVRDNGATSDLNEDGIVNAKDDAIARACHAATTYGIIFYTVGFGKDAGASTLQKIADCSGTEGRYFQGNSPEELTEIYKQISRMVSNAGTSDERMYGQKSLYLSAYGQDNPIAASETFDVYPAAHEQYNFSFYRKLELEPGYKFNVSVLFFDRDMAAAGAVWKEYDGPVQDTVLGKDYLVFSMPPNAAKAMIILNFNSRDAGDVMLDDLYLGPVLSCVAEGGGYRCGELFISKVSNDADIYPYVERNLLGPKGAVTIKDANCHGDCKYKISTTSNTIDASVGCAPS